MEGAGLQKLPKNQTRGYFFRLQTSEAFSQEWRRFLPVSAFGLNRTWSGEATGDTTLRPCAFQFVSMGSLARVIMCLARAANAPLN